MAPNTNITGLVPAQQPPPQHLLAGAATRQGHKAALPGCQNQDVHLVLPLGRGLLLAAVFDGHGRTGHLASRRVREVFEQRAPCLVAAAATSMLPGAFADIFAAAHAALVGERLASMAGTTATAALVNLSAGRVTVAHVGDSTAVLAVAGKVAFVSADHKVDDEAVRRIAHMGGEVRTLGASGVHARRLFAKGSMQPGIAMSRALGDEEAQALGLRSDPDIVEVPLPPGFTLIVASDGVWDKLAPEAVMEHVETRKHAGSGRLTAERLQLVATSVVSEARLRWPATPIDGDIDDITAIVVTVASE